MIPNYSFLVNEIYPCLQGEGVNLGKPSLLIRLQICNLRCVWCDTPYTHTLNSDPSDPQKTDSVQNFSRMSLDTLVNKIRSFSQLKNLIISGGEPTLQNLAPLIDQLKSTHTIEVESNGTQIPHLNHRSFETSHYNDVQWNISPKSKNAKQEIVPDALSHWATLARTHPKVYFKFVVQENNSASDVFELKKLIADFGIPSERVILMAEGTTKESQLNNEWLEKICLENIWILSPRLHVLTHGPLRGV